MSTKQKNTLLISLLVIIASYAFVYLVLLTPRKDVVAQRDSLAAEIEVKNTRLKAINDLRPILPDIDKKVGQITTIALPKGEQIPDLIEQVEQVLLSVGDFRIVTFSPTLGAAGAGAGGLGESQFTVSVAGNVSKVGILFDAINTNMRPLFIRTVSMVPDPDSASAPDQVLVTLSMFTTSVPEVSVAADQVANGGVVNE